VEEGEEVVGDVDDEGEEEGYWDGDKDFEWEHDAQVYSISVDMRMGCKEW
jgi:hypothetical protein